MQQKVKNRLYYILAISISLIGFVGFFLYSFKENISLYYTPQDFIKNEIDEQRNYRIGGFVEKGSLQYLEDGRITFFVTDFVEKIPVEYKGLLPAIFREEQGVIAFGTYKDGIFFAKKVLAKHDENYKPPSVERVIKTEMP